MTSLLWTLLGVVLVLTHGVVFVLARWHGRRSAAEEIQRLEWANEVLKVELDRSGQQLLRRVEEESKKRPQYAVGSSMPVAS